MSDYLMCCLMCQSKLLVYNKKDGVPHFVINGTDVSTCEKTIHLGNVLSTTNMYEMVFDGIKKCNCSANRLMFEFGSLQTVVKTNCFIGIVVHCMDDFSYGHCGMTVLARCAHSSVMLCARKGIYHMVRTEI